MTPAVAAEPEAAPAKPALARPSSAAPAPAGDQPGALGARTALPPQQQEPKPFNVWSFLKDAAGKHLFVLPLPIGFYLPLTELQFRCEELEYTALLDAAAAAPRGSRERAALVAAFALSHYSATVRVSKPILPMHGETFDIYLPDRGVRVLSEVVYTNFKEHTVNNAWVAHGRGWTLEADDSPLVKLAGGGMDLHLNWRDEVQFADGERFGYRKPKTVLHNVIVGTMHLTHHGVIKVRSSDGGGIDLEFLPEPGVLSSLGLRRGPAPEKHAVRGTYVDAAGEAVAGEPGLDGYWHQGLWRTHPDGRREQLWAVVPRKGGANRYDMADFALRLNELTPELDAVLPPTDSRRRPDVRALEEGRFDEAYDVKMRLETALTAKVRAVNAEGRRRSPPARWFELRADDALDRVAGDALRWRYKGGYWEARARGEWEGVGGDIFAAAAAGGAGAGAR